MGATIWRNHSALMMSEKSQAQESTHGVIPLSEVQRQATVIYGSKRQHSGDRTTRFGV